MGSSVIQSLCQKLLSFLHAMFNFISTAIFRLRKDGSSLKGNLDYLEVNFVVETESESEKDIAEFRGFENDVEEEKSEGFLIFKFPTFEEFSRSKKETGNSFNSELVPFTSTEFIPGSSISASVDEQENFNAKEIKNEDRNRDCYENEEIVVVNECLLDKTSEKVDNGTDDILVDEKENAVDERIEFSEEKRAVEEENNFGSDHGFLNEGQFHSEKSPVVTDSDSESSSFEHIQSVMNTLVDSYSEGFLSDTEFDFGASMDTDDEKESLDSEGELSDLEENQELSYEFDGEDSDVMEELSKLEEDMLTSDFLSENDFNGIDNSENHKSKDTSNSEDVNNLESLWEHQELIEQLNMEIRKVRATGLPTIFEESESPKIMDDLKPWKIEERFQLEDCIDELHKFYKCYRERMRKFDILNYQKMYAIGFVQLKDPLQSVSTQKKPSAPFKSIFPRDLSLFKHESRGNDTMKNFIKELRGDLEVVYVGQMCLSWEFLHWQYEKALDLWDSDPRGFHRYNEVAGEFQQFQVLMQRFIEDEPFQGPRVENYIKSRCVLRNLLQVPVIKVDSLKDKKKATKKDADEYIITSDMLVEMVEESIRIFWRFVRADKGCTSASVKEKPELLNPEDLELLMELRKTLQKKERKLKDILRSENCILRRIRRYRDDDSDQVLYFFAQVDMKLISRVVNMSKISRDQLIWCHNKLNRISFASRKIYMEPSFLLFPC